MLSDVTREDRALRHPPLSSSAKAGDPVLRGLTVDYSRLWNTGSPAFAGDDGYVYTGHDPPSLATGRLMRETVRPDRGSG